jgi:hypothetical protein
MSVVDGAASDALKLRSVMEVVTAVVPNAEASETREAGTVSEPWPLVM